MGENAFDAVVIGSGLGGLTAAALLAKSGRKVCVIERNHSVGGAASAFKKGALTIEPSLHQTVDPRDPTDVKHAILSHLGLLDEIEWVPVRPFYSVRGGLVGDVFDMPVGLDAAHHALSSRFPKSRGGSAQFFGAISEVFDAVTRLREADEGRSVKNLLGALLTSRRLARDWRASAADMLNRFFGDDEAAKTAIGATVGYYSDNADRLAWPFFAIAQAGFHKSGGVFAKGGSRVLSMKLAKVVSRAGGSVLLGREAVGVDLAADGRPAAVRHVDSRTGQDTARVETRRIFANCAPHVLAHMLPAVAATKFAAAYEAAPLSLSLFSAHFGLSRKPAEIGLDRYSISVQPDWAIHWSDLTESAILLARDPGPRMPQYGITNYGAIDSGLDDAGPTLVTVVGVDRLDNWLDLPPEVDKARRERWLDAFQAAMDRDYPGFAAAVTERMFLSARSMANFMNTPGGAVYGFAPLPFERSILAGAPRSPRTPLPGIYLASSFAMTGGFAGAMKAGADAARMAARDGNGR